MNDLFLIGEKIMDIELHPNDWDDIHVKVSAMYYSIDDLVAVNGYLEEAESAINQHDVDNLISFSHTSKKSKLGELNSDLSTLMSYAETEPQYIADHYDKPFYDKIDEYVDDMQDLDVNSYEVKNNLGIKEIVHKQVAGPNGTETKNLLENKDKINLDDIFAGNNALSEMMQAEWKYYKKNGGKNITYADFMDGMLNSASFNYKSQKDSQVKLENIVSVALILGSFISGPVGMACFTILLAADATSLSTGKNIFTGRKISDSEKWQLAAGLALSGFGQATKIFRGGKVTKIPALGVDTAKTFNGGIYTGRVLTEDTYFYRVYGGNAGKVGRYLSRTPQSGGMQSQIDLALNPEWGNTAEHVTRVKVPKGTIIYEGHAAPQPILSGSGYKIGELKGGGNQIYIEEVRASWFGS